MAQVNQLGTDRIGKLVLRLAIPSMLAQFVNVLYSIVDRMYIGNIPVIGDTALAGVGVCGPIVTLISSFAFLVGVGGAPLIAMRLGEKNSEGARRILANCFLLLVGISAVLTVLFLVFRRPLLLTFGASEATIGYAVDYLTIYVLGTVFALLSVGLNQFVICQGLSSIGMVTVLIGAVSNIILDPVFIFIGNMGVRGAALATILSQAVSCCFVILILRGKRVTVRLTLGAYSWKIMKRVLTFGLSPFIIVATDSILIIAFNSVLQRYGGASQGDAYVTCGTIVQSFMQLITMPMAGITGGTQPVLSYNYGAKNTARVRAAFGRIILLCVAFTSVMFLVSQFASHLFVQIFTRQEELVSFSVWGIRTYTLGIIPLALQYEIVDGFTALGIARVAVTLSLNRKILYLVLTLLLPMFFGASGAFYAEPAVDMACGVVSTIVFFLLFNRLMRQRDAMPDGQALYS